MADSKKNHIIHTKLTKRKGRNEVGSHEDVELGKVWYAQTMQSVDLALHSSGKKALFGVSLFFGFFLFATS